MAGWWVGLGSRYALLEYGMGGASVLVLVTLCMASY